MAVDDQVQLIAKKLEQQPEVLLAYLFGSHAKGKARPDSDIDIAVLVDESKIAGGHLDTQMRLSALIDNDRVDLVILNDAPPLLQHQVLKHGIKLFSRDKAKQVDFVFNAITRYLDTIYLRQIHSEALHRRIKEGRFGRVKGSDRCAVEQTRFSGLTPERIENT